VEHERRPRWNSSPSRATTSARPARPRAQELPSRSRTADVRPAGGRPGLDVDDFAPRLSFFFNAQIDFFEEIAKYRAARRIWARELRDTFGAKDPRSLLMRFHTQTAGVSLTAQQPLNNIVRTAVEALAGVLGGTQSLHTNSYDEALALPERAGGARRAAHAADHRHETGRRQHDRPARRLVLRRSPHGRARARRTATSPRSTSSAAWSRPVKRGYPQREIADAAFTLQQEIESGERILVGVNGHREGDEQPLELLHVNPALERKQIDRVQAVRAARDAGGVERALADLRAAAADDAVNLMPNLVACARVRATEGEIVESLQQVFGTYTETPVF
jgi:methylmalonyl-CoA mutase N-terminal domain/subunit